MNCLYPLNQPGYAMLGEEYQAYPYGKSGIVNFYSFAIERQKQFEQVTILPDGVVDLVFIKHADKNIRIYSYGTPLKGSELYEEFPIQQGDWLFGVELLPDAAAIITQIESAECIDCVIEITKQSQFQHLGQQIYHCQTFLEQVQTFLAFYNQKYVERYYEKIEENRLPSYVLEQIILSKGTKHMNEIGEQACYTTRYIDKLFTSQYGITPKYFGRIVRFQNIVSELMKEQHIIDISETVQMYEGNLIREFKAMSGSTPKEYRKVLAEYKKIIKEN